MTKPFSFRRWDQVQNKMGFDVSSYTSHLHTTLAWNDIDRLEQGRNTAHEQQRNAASRK